MIADDLKTTENRHFGDFPIHRLLLPEQLDALAKIVPAIAEQEAFVFAKLRKLAPGADADAEFDPAEREAWLERAVGLREDAACVIQFAQGQRALRPAAA
jgi:hypothetical protein